MQARGRSTSDTACIARARDCGEPPGRAITRRSVSRPSRCRPRCQYRPSDPASRSASSACPSVATNQASAARTFACSFRSTANHRAWLGTPQAPSRPVHPGRRSTRRAPRPGLASRRRRRACRLRTAAASPASGTWCARRSGRQPPATAGPAAPAGPARRAPVGRSSVTHRLGRGQGPPAAEHRQPAEQHLLLPGEQVVAPVDRVAQRLLAGLGGAVAGGQHARTGPAPGRPTRPAADRPAWRLPVPGPAECRPAGGRSRRPQQAPPRRE